MFLTKSQTQCLMFFRKVSRNKALCSRGPCSQCFQDSIRVISSQDSMFSAFLFSKPSVPRAQCSQCAKPLGSYTSKFLSSQTSTLQGKLFSESCVCLQSGSPVSRFLCSSVLLVPQGPISPGLVLCSQQPTKTVSYIPMALLYVLRPLCSQSSGFSVTYFPS